MSSLASTHNVCDLLVINPLIMLHQNSCMIHSESHDGHLILNGVFILVLLRVFRKGELSFCLSSIFMRHDDGGKEGAKELTKIHLIYIRNDIEDKGTSQSNSFLIHS